MTARQIDVMSCLAAQRLFAGMPVPELERIAAQARIRHLDRGEALFHAGQACEGLYLVAEGLVKLYARGPAAQEKVIEVIPAGGCIPEAPMFSDGRHGMHAAALSDACLLIVPRDALLREIERDAGLAMRMLAGLSGRFNNLVKDIEAVTLHSGVQRVAGYLLHAPGLAGAAADRADQTDQLGQADQCDPRPRRDVTVSLPASKGTIASLLSVTPEHFSRILHDLQARGLIAVRRRQIHILDPQALAQCG